MVSIITIIGLLALIGGLSGFITFPFGVKMGVKYSVNLAKNGPVYPLYMSPPFPTRSEFRLFAITNPKEVLRGDKMEFEVKGPYVYRTFLERENIQFSNEDERVSYGSRRRLYLDEEGSADMDERMWLLNPIVPSTVKSVKMMVLDKIPFQSFSEPIVYNAVNLLLSQYKERLIKRTTPRDFLQGKEVELLVAITGLASRFGLQSLVPPGPPENKFGLAFAQNETVDDIEIFTGVGRTRDKFAEVSRWHEKTEVTAWRGRCRTINGTNGELYKPFISESKPIKIFLGPLCRSFYLEPVVEETTSTSSGEKEDPPLTSSSSSSSSSDNGQQQQRTKNERTGKKRTNSTIPRKRRSRDPSEIGEHKQVITETGIKALVYEFSPSLYTGARTNPSNRCYCENVRSYDCQYDGLISMGPCFFDAPLYFSRGNFKGVDKRISGTTRFLQTVGDGLPDKQHFSLEKTTGTVVAVDLTIMGIFKVVKQPSLNDLARVRNVTYVPAFSTTETVRLPWKYAWQIYMLQKMIQNYEPAMAVTAGSGVAILLAKRFLFGAGSAQSAAAVAANSS